MGLSIFHRQVSSGCGCVYKFVHDTNTRRSIVSVCHCSGFVQALWVSSEVMGLFCKGAVGQARIHERGGGWVVGRVRDCFGLRFCQERFICIISCLFNVKERLGDLGEI